MADGVSAQRKVGDQIETLMGEFRVVLPALAVLFGFQLTVVFQVGFKDLPGWARVTNFLALSSTAIAIAFMIAPISYHRFTRGLEESYGYLHMAQRNVGAALFFLVLSITLSILLQAHESFGDLSVSIAAALGLALILALAWWVFPLWRARRRGTFARRWLPHHDPDEHRHDGSDGPAALTPGREDR